MGDGSVIHSSPEDPSMETTLVPGSDAGATPPVPPRTTDGEEATAAPPPPVPSRTTDDERATADQASRRPQIPDHQLLRCIGRGSYGEVWLARNVMGTCRAVKGVYRDSFEDARPFERELSGIRRFEPVSRLHDGLVDILQVGRNDPEGYFYYVMELADD